jgi:cytochrome-b5 reductase
MTSEANYSAKDIALLLKDQKKVVILFGGVYDLTKYIHKHPGGKDVINNNLGKDATEKFVSAGHLTKTRVVELLAKFRMGKYVPEAKL